LPIGPSTTAQPTAQAETPALGETAPAVPAVDPQVLAWVRAALRGDQDAFAQLVYTYQDAVFNLCYRILNDRGEAEDAAQEAFLRAYLNLSRYDSARSFKTWLLTIASNHAIDRIRRRRMQTYSIDDDLLPAFSLSSDEPEPEDVSIERERSRAMAALLNRLAPDYRAAVVLRYWYDYSYIEIADMLHTTESAIKSRLFRARQMLAEMMGEGEADAAGSDAASGAEAGPGTRASSAARRLASRG
jgi:RNA polymerase sigma-70 factor (ECF subfamily)